MRFSGLLLSVAIGAGLASAADEAINRRFADLLDRGLGPRDLASEILGDIESAADCAACEGIIVLLQGLAVLGNTIFVDTLTELCELSGAEDDDVCKGLLAEEGPTIAQDIRGLDIGSKTSELFCVTFLGLCPYPSVDAYTVPFPSPKPSNGRPAPSGQTPLKIVHYSDIHIDPFYVAGSNTNCTKPICCRDYTTADSPGHNSAPAGPNGDHNCDAPLSLEESMYAAVQQIAPDAAFSIFTGDIVDHAIWNTTQAQNTIDINDAYSRMASSGMRLVYGTAGNHESSPVNFFQTTKEGKQAQWVYNLLASNWNRWIGGDAAATAEVTSIGAYATRYANTKLRIISLNTNLYYVDNFYLYEDPMERDPDGQLAWLVQQLDAAEKAGDRVYIMGHMPLGLSDAFHDASNYFDQIVNRYSSTIAAMFFGHTHVDHFQISYSDYSNQRYSTAQAVSYIAPSLTPTSGMPSFRVYTVDPATFAVLDAETYAADMTNPAFQQTQTQTGGGPVWTRYYSAREAYGPLVSPPLAAGAELSPAFWHNVTAALAADQGAFDAYYARKSRGWDVQPCTGACVTAEICALRAARAENNCVVPTPGIHFSKRKRSLGGDGDGNGPGPLAHRDECGVSAARETISTLVRRDMLTVLAARVLEKRALVGA